MLQELLWRLPPAFGSMPLNVILGATAAGVGLAIGGARYSRSLITLAAVTGGTLLGLHAPGWIGMKVDGIGAAFCGAIFGGAVGFIFDRFFTGLMLALLLAFVGGGLAWVIRAPSTSWTIPAIDYSAPMPVILSQIWKSLPDGLSPALPMAVLVGLSLGTLLTAVWVRLGRVILYSLLGTTTMTLFGALAIQQLSPQWLTRLPGDARMELAIFAGIVAVSMLVQWLLLPRKRGSGHGSSQKRGDSGPDQGDALLFPSPTFAGDAFPIDQKRQETASRRQRVALSQS